MNKADYQGGTTGSNHPREPLSESELEQRRASDLSQAPSRARAVILLIRAHPIHQKSAGRALVQEADSPSRACAGCLSKLKSPSAPVHTLAASHLGMRIEPQLEIKLNRTTVVELATLSRDLLKHSSAPAGQLANVALRESTSRHPYTEKRKIRSGWMAKLEHSVPARDGARATAR